MEFWGEIWSLLRADYKKEYNINPAIIKLILGLIMNLFDISSLIPLKKFKKKSGQSVYLNVDAVGSLNRFVKFKINIHSWDTLLGTPY